LDGFVHVGKSHALLEHFVAVHLDKFLRHTGEKGGAQTGDFRALACGIEENAQVFGEELNIAPGAVLEVKSETSGSAHAGNSRGRKAERKGGWQPAQGPVDASLDGLILLGTRLALVPGLEGDKEEGVVAGAYVAEQAEADDAGRVSDARHIGEDLLNLTRHGAGALQRSRIRKLHVDEGIALVFIGQEAGGQTAAKESGANGEGRNHHQGQRALTKNPSADFDVDLGAAPEHAIESFKKPAKQPAALLLWPEQQRGKRGAER